MPTSSTARDAEAHVARLTAALPEVPVAALMRLADDVEALLARPSLTPADVLALAIAAEEES